ILLVPVVIWAITAGEMSVALALFLLAGISDAVDGFLAKRFGMRTELGGYLDPLADKAMLVSIFIALAAIEAVPRWLVIFVVACALLWLLREVLLPFVAGMGLAYVLAPVADRLERAGLNRTVAALSIVGLVILSLIAVALLILPLAVQQSVLLLSKVPSYV